MAANTSDNKKTERYEFKEQLVKAARTYAAMCQKARVAEPMDVPGLAVAAFEDMPLRALQRAQRQRPRLGLLELEITREVRATAQTDRDPAETRRAPLVKGSIETLFPGTSREHV